MHLICLVMLLAIPALLASLECANAVDGPAHGNTDNVREQPFSGPRAAHQQRLQQLRAARTTNDDSNTPEASAEVTAAKRPVGRPKGSKDTYKRKRHNSDAGTDLIDPDRVAVTRAAAATNPRRHTSTTTRTATQAQNNHAENRANNTEQHATQGRATRQRSQPLTAPHFNPGNGLPTAEHAWSLTIGVVGDGNVPRYWLDATQRYMQVRSNVQSDMQPHHYVNG